MQSHARKLVLAIVFLSVLPVVGTEMSSKTQVVMVGAEDRGASVHFKTSAWPVIVSHRVASGIAASTKAQI